MPFQTPPFSAILGGHAGPPLPSQAAKIPFRADGCKIPHLPYATKNAKDAKNAKNANPRRLALLALLGRSGDLIAVRPRHACRARGAEAGGYHNRLWQEMLVPQFLGAPLAGGRGTTIGCGGGALYIVVENDKGNDGSSADYVDYAD